MYLLAYLAIQSGCIVLSFNLPKHFRGYFKSSTLTKSKKVVFNLSGYGLLAIGLYCCTCVDRFDIALTTFLGLLTVAIFAWALMMGLRKA